jgi:hypothetical protein
VRVVVPAHLLDEHDLMGKALLGLADKTLGLSKRVLGQVRCCLPSPPILPGGSRFAWGATGINQTTDVTPGPCVTLS